MSHERLRLAKGRPGVHSVVDSAAHPHGGRWWRNVEPLARAGFEVIVPDLAGFGDSELAPDGFYDPAAHARDLHALVHDVLGHARCGAVGGDLGGVVIQDLGLRFAGFVERQCLFNTVLPMIPDAYVAAGLPAETPRGLRMASDYFLRQANDADGLAAELDTPEKRRRYVAEFYGHRFWASPGTFKAEDVAFMTEPFADADRFRAGIANYEGAFGKRPTSEMVRFFEPNPIPTLVLFGPDDHVVGADFMGRSEVYNTLHCRSWEEPSCSRHRDTAIDISFQGGQAHSRTRSSGQTPSRY